MRIGQFSDLADRFKPISEVEFLSLKQIEYYLPSHQNVVDFFRKVTEYNPVEELGEFFVGMGFRTRNDKIELIAFSSISFFFVNLSDPQKKVSINETQKKVKWEEIYTPTRSAEGMFRLFKEQLCLSVGGHCGKLAERVEKIPN